MCDLAEKWKEQLCAKLLREDTQEEEYRVMIPEHEPIYRGRYMTLLNRSLKMFYDDIHNNKVSNSSCCLLNAVESTEDIHVFLYDTKASVIRDKKSLRFDDQCNVVKSLVENVSLEGATLSYTQSMNVDRAHVPYYIKSKIDKCSLHITLNDL